MRRIFLSLITFMVVISLLAGCSTSGETIVKGVGSAPADVPPQTDGTIDSIISGNPSYAILKNVNIVKDKSNGQGLTHIKKSELKVKLPSGHFVSPKHWQSEGDTLDLFVGDDLTLVYGQIIDNATYDQEFEGLVESVSSDQMVIQKILYADTTDSNAMKYTNQTVTIHLAPYTKVSLNGDNQTKTSEIRKGDAVLFILIGPPSDFIATQITDFHSIHDAGWDMVNKPQ
jgi:hypothetical protein